MFTRTLFALAVFTVLASGCVVAGEDDAALDDIAATSCSKDPTGDLQITSLRVEGREMSYRSLTTSLRQLLDTTIGFTDRNTRGSGSCEFYTNGWYCVTDFGECGCEHTDTGPDCYCQDGC